jgi:uncharacterized protein (TIGR00255 family)
MTGFGSGSASLDELRVTVELRTLNNRFADLRMRLPSGLGDRERGIRKKVLARVRRGRIDLSLSVGREGEGRDAPALNRPLLEAVIAAGHTLRDDYAVGGELTAAKLLAIPGMVRADSPDVEWGDEQAGALERALDAALEALDQDRLREGAVLQAELSERIGAMEHLASEIRTLAAGISGKVRERLVERLRALAEDLELDEGRVAQEAVILADRADVTEEIVRLEGHLEQAASLLRSEDGEPVGKRLEFLVQEILRETNTIGSKSASIELTRTAMAVKAEVEKVREQVQNLE